MLAFSLCYAALFADPVTLVQLRYPAHRTTVTTASGYNVFYTLPANAPPELRRAYKLLEIAERDVLVTDTLQQFRIEILQNDRRLEGLRTARLAAYLTGTASGSPPSCDYGIGDAGGESRLRGGLADGLVADATVERAQLALDRLMVARYQLHVTLVAIAYPDRAKVARQPQPRPAAVAAAVPAARPAAVPVAVPAAVPVAVPAAPRAPGPLLAAERAEKAAAEAEALAAEWELTARQNERAAETLYRNSVPADRPAARMAWLKTREEWELARRDWDTAREQWQASRDRLEAARAAPKPAAPPAAFAIPRRP